MRFGELTKRLGCLRRRVFPAFPPTARRLGSETHDPRASFREAQRNGMASPTEYGFRLRKVVKAKPQKKIPETDAIFDNIKKKMPKPRYRSMSNA